jgi:hypothetical protein
MGSRPTLLSSLSRAGFLQGNYYSQYYEALVAAEQNRATYLLASMIVDPLEPEKSIAELEAIGEEKLRTMENAKDVK